MIIGTHAIIYSKDAEADRAFFRDILGLKSVDAGEGWLIFALPPAECGIHPGEKNDQHELYLMCDDLESEMASLAEKGIECGEVHQAPWGALTSISLPGGGKLGMYQPRHPMAIEGK